MPASNLGRALAPALFLSATGSPAAAELADRTAAEPIIVTARQSAALTADTPEDTRRALDRLPGGASVVDLAEQAGRRSATLADALRLAPGVFATPRFGPEDLRISIRGSGIVRTGHAKGMLVVRDDVPVNAADGEFDALSLDLGAGSHLAVLRGPVALGAGATTLGGAIVMESKTGRTAPGVTLGAEGGSFATWRVHGQGGLAGQTIDGFLAFSTAGSDGYRAHALTRSQRVAANAGWRLAPALETRLYAGHTDLESEWPGVLTRAQYEANPRQASLVALRRDQDNNIRHNHVASRTVWAPGPHRVTLALGLQDRRKDHATPEGILLEETGTLVGSLVHAWQPLEGPLALSLGARATRSLQDRRIFAYAGGLLSPVSAVRGGLSSSRDRLARTLELFGRAEWSPADALTVTGSLAALWTDRRDRPAPDSPTPPEPAWRVDYHDVLPGLGLLWRPTGRITLFAGWAQSFEAPSFFDLGGNAPLFPDRIPRLRAQTADTIEGGARGVVGPLRFDVTLHHARLRDELLRLDAAFRLTPPIINAGRTRRTGLEAAATLDLASMLGATPGTLALAAKWDWLDARFDDDPVFGSNRIAGIPSHSAHVELAAEPLPGLVIRPNVTLRSPTEVDMANTPGTQAGGFALLGLSARWERGRIALWADARNLADRRHVSAVNVGNRADASSAMYFPGDGRALYAGITLNFAGE